MNNSRFSHPSLKNIFPFYLNVAHFPYLSCEKCFSSILQKQMTLLWPVHIKCCVSFEQYYTPIQSPLYWNFQFLCCNNVYFWNVIFWALNLVREVWECTLLSYTTLSVLVLYISILIDCSKGLYNLVQSGSVFQPEGTQFLVYWTIAYSYICYIVNHELHVGLFFGVVISSCIYLKTWFSSIPWSKSSWIRWS